MRDDRITLGARVVAARDQVSANVSGESVILGMQTGVYYGLDAVGTRIWELIQQPAILSDVADQIEREFNVSRSAAATDLLAFAKDLSSHGLIESVAD